METPASLSAPDVLASCLKHRGTNPRAVHGLSFKLGCLASTFLCNHLIHSYDLHSMLADARKVFDETPHPNVVTWSVVISGYSQMGNVNEAISLFRELLQGRHCGFDDNGDLFPNTFTFGSIVTGCARTKDLITGAQLHCSMIKSGVEPDLFISGALIDMYAKCGEVDRSRKVFDQAREKDVVSYTSLITCLVKKEKAHYWDLAFDLFTKMICYQIWPVGMTFSSLLRTFDEPQKLGQGKQVHGCMVKLGIEVDRYLESALIAMYGKCGGMDELVRLSARMGDDVVSWTSLVVAYMQNGYNEEAIDVFREMIARNAALDPSVITSVAGACSCLRLLDMGKQIHGYSMRTGFMSDISTANAIITLYGRCGEANGAERVFELMLEKDIISWTALLNCYSQNDHGEAALAVFRQMLQLGLNLPVFCITGALRACAATTNLHMGRQIHSGTVRLGFDNNMSIENSLITMYAKCGSMDAALKIFNSMAKRCTVSWNALISGYSQHGEGMEALEIFELMQGGGMEPDDYTFTGLLAFCARVGLVAKGCEYFKKMSAEHELEPKMDHYACMVDLFGRAGRIHDAVMFINAMPCCPDPLVWEALLAYCKLHGYVELGRIAAKKASTIEDQGRKMDPSGNWIEAYELSEEKIDASQVGGI